MAKFTIAQRNRAIGMLQTGMSSKASTRVKLMSFDHYASLDIISADRQYFGATKNWAHEGHDSCTRPLCFLICVLN